MKSFDWKTKQPTSKQQKPDHREQIRMRIWGKLCLQSISARVQGSPVPLLYIRLNVNMCTITCGGESNNADNGSLCASWLWMCAAVEASMLCKRLTHGRKYIKKTYWLTCKAEWNRIGLNIECEMCFFQGLPKWRYTHTPWPRKAPCCEALCAI